MSGYMINPLKTLRLLAILGLICSQLTGTVYAQSIVGYNERIEQQELEIRRLTGEVETLKYQNKNVALKLKGLRKEIELRFKSLETSQEPLVTNSIIEKKTTTPPTQGKAEKDAVSKIIAPAMSKKNSEKKTQITPTTVKALYQTAQAHLKTRDYIKAEEGFNTIIQKYPDASLVPNAYYWLGETYYSRKDYSKAALTFLEGKRKFPESTKAGHNLLKLGLSLHYLKQKKDACLTFLEVEKNYVPKDKSLGPTVKSSQAKAGCV